MSIGSPVKGFRSALWHLLAPVRWYLRYFPLTRGKGILLRYLLLPILPDDQFFTATVMSGARIQVRCRETIGLAILIYGGFEDAEIQFLCQHAGRGSTVIDIGANIGIFAIPLAAAVGPSGKVLAVEPVAENVRRLEHNLMVNRISHVHIFHCAVGDREGEVQLAVGMDTAYATLIGDLVPGNTSLKTERVPQKPIDQLWRSIGSPTVDVVKIDVEGSELSVLKGASELLDRTRPLLMVEVNSDSQLLAVKELMTSSGFAHRHPDGFAPWNHIFIPLDNS